jgi:hypothetical protein
MISISYSNHISAIPTPDLTFPSIFVDFLVSFHNQSYLTYSNSTADTLGGHYELGIDIQCSRMHGGLGADLLDIDHDHPLIYLTYLIHYYKIYTTRY